MERERRNGGKEPKRTGLPARPRIVQPASQPIEFESRSTSWQTVPNAVLVLRCHVAVTPDITTRKEKARHSDQERERDRKKGREKERRTVEALHFLPSCNFYDSRKTAIFTGSTCIGSTFLLCFFSHFFALSPYFSFSLVFFLLCTSCYMRFVNSCFFTDASRDSWLVFFSNVYNISKDVLYNVCIWYVCIKDV